MQSLRAFLSGFSLLLLSLLLASCGGGGSGVFTDNKLGLEVFVEKASVPVNMVQDPIGPGSPYVSEVAVRVRDSGSGQPVQGATVNVSFIGAQVGGLFTEQDFFRGQGIPQPAVSASSDSGGWVRVYFVAGTIAGQAQLRIRADRVGGAPQTGADASTVIQVVSTAGPPSAIEFTGPYIDAIRTNRVQFGLAPGETFDFQNGTYSRVISVTVNDASGNPVPVNTPIRFHLIDAPLVGYPELGSGFFAMQGLGDPQEGGFVFDSIGGNFVAQGARVGDRLVLDPHPDDSSFFHAGIRTTVGYPPDLPNRLLIRSDEQPFRMGPNLGSVVPYAVGRARAGSIQSLAFTDTNGVASTLLTYPFSNLGRTAILVAHTQDYSVSRVFNPGGPVYLGVVGENFSLSVSPTVLPSNVNDGLVWLCVRDENFVPLPGTWVAFSTSGSTGAAVDVNGLGANGFVETGAGGCALAVVNVVGQIPGENIRIGFSVSALGEDREVEVSVLAPNTATLLGSPNCEAGTLDLTYLTDGAQPIPGAVVTASNVQWPSGEPDFVFDPPADAGASAGITDDAGSVSVGFTLGAVGGSYEATFQTDRGQGRYDLACVVVTPDTPEVNLVGGGGTLPVGGSTTLAVVLDAPATADVQVNVLTTGDTAHFTVQPVVTIMEGDTSAPLQVAVNPGAPDGASIQVRLVAGAGYVLGDTVGPLTFTVSAVAETLPAATLLGLGGALAPSGFSTLAVALGAPATMDVTVNVLMTGDTDAFTVLPSVTISAGQTSVPLTVTANPTALTDDSVQVRLVAGAGYTVGTPAGPLTFTVNDALSDLPRAVLTNPGSLTTGLQEDDTVTLAVTLDRPAAVATQVNVLVTGTNIDRFRLVTPGAADPIPVVFPVMVAAGASTANLVVAVNEVTVQGEINLQVTNGLGYTLAGTTSNVITLRTAVPPAP